MGLFDFFKKKEEPTAEETPQQEGVFSEEGISVEVKQEEAEPIVLHVEEELETTTAINRAVHEVMDEEEVEFHERGVGKLYEEAPDIEAGLAQKNSVPQQEEAVKEAEEADTDKIAVAQEEAEETREETETNVQEEVQTAPKKGFFAKLKEGLQKTRSSILGGVDSVLGGFTQIDEDLFEELEEALIMADLGVSTSMELVETLRKRVKKEHLSDPADIRRLLEEEITVLLEAEDAEQENLPRPTVMLVIGVNGVGKTTTIGKLAHLYREDGRSVMLAAADTFRAAAIDQLGIWAERSAVPMVKKEENSDPAAVVFEAVHQAKNSGTDLLICDTAGRLHNKKNLMEELRKIARVIEREWPEAHKEVYLVLDATTGQNALQQAKVFREVADITGIILTKLDGTAKGGIVVAIKSELQIPVRYIGVGEAIEDLQKFHAEQFAKALFGTETE